MTIASSVLDLFTASISDRLNSSKMRLWLISLKKIILRMLVPPFGPLSTTSVGKAIKGGKSSGEIGTVSASIWAVATEGSELRETTDWEHPFLLSCLWWSLDHGCSGAIASFSISGIDFGYDIIDVGGAIALPSSAR